MEIIVHIVNFVLYFQRLRTMAYKHQLYSYYKTKLSPGLQWRHSIYFFMAPVKKQHPP